MIGGGDWSEDRLIPDLVRSVEAGKSLEIRSPNATRPWQHVLALVHGYLMILAGLASESPGLVARPWNLGPQEVRQYSVREVLELMCLGWARPELEYMDNPLPEARALALDSSLARHQLGWVPAWRTERVVAETAAWYRDYYRNPESVRDISLAQISAWREDIQA